MNILLISSMYLPHLGGVELTVYNLAKEFQRQGHQVTVLAARFPHNLEKYEVLDGVPISRSYFPFPGKSIQATLAAPILGPFVLYRLVQSMRKQHFDIVNLHFADYAALYAAACRRLTGIPLAISLHGSDINRIPYTSRTRRALLKYALHKADVVIANSANLLAAAQSLAPAIGTKGVIIPLGIAPAELADVQAYDAGRPYVLALGRLDYVKGFDILLKAIAQAKEQEPDIFLLLAGDGPERSRLEKLISDLVLEKHVRLVGRVDRQQAAALFQGCLFFVLPSRAEAFGMVNLEAMAAGKAVVAFAVGGIPEVVQDGQNGILIAPGDQDSLAKAILRLWRDATLRERLGTTGQQVVYAHYTWDKIALKYLNIYTKLSSPNAATFH